jgi:hypothetical protein
MNDSVLGGDAWHPLRSLTRTNGSCDKLFHSFYFVDIIDCDADNLSIALQVPSYKRSRDDVAEGLLYFAGEIARSLKQEYIEKHKYNLNNMNKSSSEDSKVGEILLSLDRDSEFTVSGDDNNDSNNSNYANSQNTQNDNNSNRKNNDNDNDENKTSAFDSDTLLSKFDEEERYGTFVLTSGTATKYYLSWRGTSKYMFVAASTIPFIGITRQIFDMIFLTTIPVNNAATVASSGTSTSSSSSLDAVSKAGGATTTMFDGNGTRTSTATSTFISTAVDDTNLNMTMTGGNVGQLSPTPSLMSTLLSLCILPILPACGLRYHLKFDNNNILPIQFSKETEQIDDR